jgi:glycine hydroxymethyltransferase
MSTARALLARTDAEVEALIRGEEQRQQRGIELIPSENYTYPEVLAALGSVLTNKYSEGYPGRRYYGGQRFTDALETLARERAQRLFRCEHANVQPLSGSPMNQAVYFAFLEPGDTILGMDLSHGGHLTHGALVSHMGEVFRFVRYKTRSGEAGRIDLDELAAVARQTRPRLVLCGSSSYPREYDYAGFRRIADEVGAIAMADISHVGGLVAAGAMRNPFDDGFDVVTTTTHKSLRGPRGGLVLCRREHAARIDRSVFPGLQGGPHMHTVAGVAIALERAAQPDFSAYAQQVLRNAKQLAASLLERGLTLVTGGTDNHMLVVDTIASAGIDGHEAEARLDAISIAVNKQLVPDDPRPPRRPSGIRIGTPAATTRGPAEPEMVRLAGWIADALGGGHDPRALQDAVESLCARFPVPGLAAGEAQGAPAAAAGNRSAPSSSSIASAFVTNEIV